MKTEYSRTIIHVSNNIDGGEAEQREDLNPSATSGSLVTHMTTEPCTHQNLQDLLLPHVTTEPSSLTAADSFESS